MSSAPHDAIVVGAGHNGLTCACYLARAGLRVLVLEANDDIGGLTVTREVTAPGFHSDLHAFGYQLANLSPAPDELELDRHGLELLTPDISFAHSFGDGTALHMHADLEQTCASIARRSAHDAAQWRALFDRWLAAKDAIRDSLNSSPRRLSEQLAVLEGTPDGWDEYRLSMQSLRSWTAEWFADDAVKMFLGTFALHANVAPDEVGGGQLAWLFNSVIQDYGNKVVRGGMGNVARALARCLEEHGGQIRTDARVSRILVDAGRAHGVRLDDGELLTVDGPVVSNVDPRTLALDLLGPDVVGEDVAGRIDRYEWGDSILVIYLALERPLEFTTGPETSRACYVHCAPPSLEYVTRMFAEVRAGKLAAEPAIIVCNDSAADPSRVPSGRGLCKILVKCVPYVITGDASGKIAARDWAMAKEAYADHVLDLLARDHVPGLRDAIVARTVHSPVDQERFITSAVHGTELQGAFLPYQSGAMRPIPQLGDYRTPVPNVYLCGAGSHPGPGVSFMPGRNAALAIGHDLGLDLGTH